MTKDKTDLGRVVSIDDKRIHDHLGEMVRGTVEATLNAMLDAEAEALCGASRYQRSADRTDYRAGHYPRRLHTKAGEGDAEDAQVAPPAVRDGHRRALPTPRV